VCYDKSFQSFSAFQRKNYPTIFGNTQEQMNRNRPHSMAFGSARRDRALASAGGFRPGRRLGFSIGKPDASFEGQLLASVHAAEAGEGWSWLGEFSVMRRTHASLMNQLGVEGKLVADQLEHKSGREPERLYAIAGRKEARRGEQARKPASDVEGLNGVQTVFRVKLGSCKSLKRWSGRRGSNPRCPAWEDDGKLETQNIAFPAFRSAIENSPVFT
jgi:hypothetical protein